VDIDFNLVGRGFMVLINLTVKDHSDEARKEICEKVSSFPETVQLHHVLGTFDYVCVVRVKDLEEYRLFLLNKLSKVKGIQDIDSHVVMETLKDAFDI
jgi:Lrp/AsnC family leucine-responsive transcriptional regulator